MRSKLIMVIIMSILITYFPTKCWSKVICGNEGQDYVKTFRGFSFKQTALNNKQQAIIKEWVKKCLIKRMYDPKLEMILITGHSKGSKNKDIYKKWALRRATAIYGEILTHLDYQQSIDFQRRVFITDGNVDNELDNVREVDVAFWGL